MVTYELASYLLSFKGLTSMHMQYNIMYLDKNRIWQIFIPIL